MVKTISVHLPGRRRPASTPLVAGGGDLALETTHHYKSTPCEPTGWSAFFPRTPMPRLRPSAASKSTSRPDGDLLLNPSTAEGNWRNLQHPLLQPCRALQTLTRF